ncbi:MAG: PAS domain S-box protein, partial [Bacteroidetes bacterium]|nr:PAS domain S-box protein [Bacteroidota bacterium]
HKDGHIIYLAVSSSLIVMNNMSYIQAFHRDISEQKKTEKILKLANSNLVTAELVAKTGSWKFSLEGKMVDISVGFKKIFGTEKSVLSIDEVRDFRLPEYQSALDETIKMLVEGQEIVNTEYKIKRLTDGAIIDVQAIAKYDSISHTMYGTVQDITERKKVEDELRFQSEITANLTDAIYLFKVENGEIVFSNTNFEKMFGYASKELNGQTVSILNAPDSGDPTETAKTIIESIKKNGSWKGEIENIKKDGTVFWCYANIKLFKHSTYGNICLAIHTDISNKKKIEKALFESNKNLKLSEFIAKLGHWKMNLDTRIFYVSDGAQKIYGLNKTEVLLEEVQSFRLPEYNSMMDEALSALIEEGKPYDIEFKIKRSNDGEIIDVHSIIEYDSNNRILFGVIQDITERKLAEQLLKYSENNLSAIFNNTNTGFILLDEQFKIVSLNKRAKELTILALDKEPVVNESIIEILPDEKQEAFSRNLYDVLLGNEIHYDINYPQKDGSPLWLDIACKPVFNEQSKIIGISYAITDLTKRKTAEKDRDKLITELLDKNNNLMQFNYIVSHNLRSPVSNLIGLSNLLKIPSNTEEEKLKIFEHIQQAALNMDKLMILLV